MCLHTSQISGKPLIMWTIGSFLTNCWTMGWSDASKSEWTNGKLHSIHGCVRLSLNPGDGTAGVDDRAVRTNAVVTPKSLIASNEGGDVVVTSPWRLVRSSRASTAADRPADTCVSMTARTCPRRRQSIAHWQYNRRSSLSDVLTFSRSVLVPGCRALAYRYPDQQHPTELCTTTIGV